MKYCLNHQSIYYDFPRLTNMSEDELIPPTVFEAIGFIESNKHPLKLWDEKNSLRLVNISSTEIKSAGLQSFKFIIFPGKKKFTDNSFSLFFRKD